MLVLFCLAPCRWEHPIFGNQVRHGFVIFFIFVHKINKLFGYHHILIVVDTGGTHDAVVDSILIFIACVGHAICKAILQSNIPGRMEISFGPIYWSHFIDHRTILGRSRVNHIQGFMDLMGLRHIQLGGEATSCTDGIRHYPLIAKSLVSLALLVFSHVLSLQNLPLLNQLRSKTFIQLPRIRLKFPSVLIV